MARHSSILMDHFNSPRNGGAMSAPSAVGRASLGGKAPRIAIYLRASKSHVLEATFQTFGCGVSIACASILTEMVRERSTSDCLTITGDDIAEALGGIEPAKRFCADVAVSALHDAVQQLGTE